MDTRKIQTERGEKTMPGAQRAAERIAGEDPRDYNKAGSLLTRDAKEGLQ
jgi:hypothetical protein